MRRGTTPTITLGVEDVDLTQASALVVTFAQAGHALEKRMGDGSVRVAPHAVAVRLTQEETLAFSSERSAKVQIRGVLAGGDAFATAIASLEVEPILSEGVI